MCGLKTCVVGVAGRVSSLKMHLGEVELENERLHCRVSVCPGFDWALHADLVFLSPSVTALCVYHVLLTP